MWSNVEQGKVIDNLNRYLKWHNLPIKMDNEGICNGLAAIYIKYALEGKQKKFLKMLQDVVNMSPNSEMKSEVNHFVTEIVRCFLPDQFDKKLTQSNSMAALEVAGKPLKSSFDLALATSDKNWKEVFEKIHLRNDEVMRVSSLNHTVAISRINKKYIVYDPNYSSGFKEFDSEKALIKELHNNVFHYSSGPMGMQVSVIKHPNSQPRDFPSISTIYNTYLNNSNINDEATIFASTSTFKTLEWAAVFMDEAAITQLHSLGATDPEGQAAIEAISSNNAIALKALLQKYQYDQLTINNFFGAALKEGREDTFDVLLQNQFCDLIFKTNYLLENNAAFVLQKAAQGGNPALLKKVIDQFPIGTTFDSIILKDNGNGDVITAAISSKNVDTVRLLMDRVDSEIEPLDDQKKMQYLLMAIRENQPYMVRFLLDRWPKYLLDISMNTRAVEKTDLDILHQLKGRGVSFPPTAKAIY